MTPDDIKNWEKRIIATERIVEFENLCRSYQGLDLVCPICSNLLIDPQDCIACDTSFCKDCISDHIKRKQQLG